MFDDGSPKTSHRLIVAIAVTAAAIVFLASFGAWVRYRTPGREIVIEDGALLAQLCSLFIVVLLIAWHRGVLAGIWPLIASLITSTFMLLFLVGDWVTGWHAAGDEF